MKKIFTVLTILFMCFSSTVFAQDNFFTVHYTGNNVNLITYNNESVDFADIDLTLSKSGTVCVPLRKTSELLDKEVIWNDAERSVIVKDETVTEKFVIDSDIMYVNGEALLMEDAAALIDSFTYVPLDFLCRSFGISVWYTPNDEAISQDLLDIRIEPLSDEELSEMLNRKYLQGELLEDEMFGMLGKNLISDEKKFIGSDIPAEYENILSETSFSSSLLKGYTVEDIRSQTNKKDMLSKTISLSDGAVQFEFPENSLEFYQYESISFDGQEDPILIEYLPKQSTQNNEAKDVPIYLQASSTDKEQKVFFVGHMYCPEGQRTAAIIDGLRTDRKYNLMLSAPDNSADTAVIRITSINK